MIDGKTTSRPFTTNGNERNHAHWTVLAPLHTLLRKAQDAEPSPRISAGLRRIEARQRPFRAVDHLPSASRPKQSLHNPTTLSLHSPNTPESTNRDSEPPATKIARRSALPVLVWRTTHTADSRRRLRGHIRAAHPTAMCNRTAFSSLYAAYESLCKIFPMRPAISSRRPPPSALYPLHQPTLGSTTKNAHGTHGTRNAVTFRPAAAQTLTNTATIRFPQSLGRNERAAGPVHPELTNSNTKHHARGPS